jgi:glycosyltransferase involved in cell wall biosynthesis
MKIAIISPKNRTTYNFRGDLIKEMITKGHIVCATGPDKTDIDKVTALGCSFTEIPMNKNGVNIFSDLKYLYNLYSFFKKEKIDVVLGYTIKPVVYGSIAAKLAGVKNIKSMITGAGYVFTAWTTKAKLIKIIVSILYKIGLACSKNIIFQNPDDMEEFIQNNLAKRKKCHIVNGSGVNMELFTRSDFPDKLTFFMLSRVMYSKGVREYLEAASRIKKNYPDIKFMLLGACENIQDSISEEDLNDYVEKGIIEYHKENPDVRKFYDMCSVYVLPSYREGTPRTVLEAMAKGRPIITTDTPGCRETVKDGKNGFLVPCGDVEKMVEAMDWMLQDDALRASCAKNATQLRMSLSVDVISEKWITYGQLI